MMVNMTTPDVRTISASGSNGRTHRIQLALAQSIRGGKAVPLSNDSRQFRDRVSRNQSKLAMAEKSTKDLCNSVGPNLIHRTHSPVQSSHISVKMSDPRRYLTMIGDMMMSRRGRVRVPRHSVGGVYYCSSLWREVRYHLIRNARTCDGIAIIIGCLGILAKPSQVEGQDRDR